MKIAQIGQYMQHVRVEINLRPSVQYDRHYADFHDIQLLVNFCKELPYRISYKSDTRFSGWYHVPDGRTDRRTVSVST
jgi:hypothetical protein